MSEKNATTKSLLLREATKQFSRDGFRKTSVRSICLKVNISVASINYHFGNKNKLINEVVFEAVYKFTQAIEFAENSCSSDLNSFLKIYLRLFSTLQQEVLLVFREVFRSDSNNTMLSSSISDIQIKLQEAAARIQKHDPFFNKLESLSERVNILHSLMAIEIIRNSLATTPTEVIHDDEWLERQISIIFAS